VRLLLDTHTFLWWDDGSLAKAVCRRIERADDVFVSAATAWEISIKAALGKISARGSVRRAIDDYGFSELVVTMEHAEEVRLLPLHHRDPFDRLIVAQARLEKLTVVSKDPILPAYGVPVLWGS
jgi:PIN domain nuclease of toxin-antitoxin system